MLGNPDFGKQGAHLTCAPGHPQVAEALHEQGVRFVAMRCAGFDKVDIGKLNELGIKVQLADFHAQHAVVSPHPCKEGSGSPMPSAGGACAYILAGERGRALCHTCAGAEQVHAWPIVINMRLVCLSCDRVVSSHACR